MKCLNQFKGFGFSQKLETNLPLIRRIGIVGFFYCKRFKIDLYIWSCVRITKFISHSKNVDIFKFQYFLRTIISFGICQKRKYQLYLLRVLFWLLKKYDYCMKRIIDNMSGFINNFFYILKLLKVSISRPVKSMIL